jgi:hypothetical protein
MFREITSLWYPACACDRFVRSLGADMIAISASPAFD